jgi:hypothetical protein
MTKVKPSKADPAKEHQRNVAAFSAWLLERIREGARGRKPLEIWFEDDGRVKIRYVPKDPEWLS